MDGKPHAGREPLLPARHGHDVDAPGEEDGLDSFYRGPLADVMAHGMETLGLPVTLADLNAHAARRTAPLTLQHQQGRSLTMPRRRRGWSRWRYSASPTA